MSSSNRKFALRPRRIRSRLVVWYATSTALCTLLFLTLAYVLLATSLQHSDRVMLRHRLAELVVRYQERGLEGVKQAVATDHALHKAHEFFVRLARGATSHLIVIPDRWGAFDIAEVEHHPVMASRDFFYVQASDDEDVLEIESARLPDGILLQVGRSSGARGAILERFLLIVAAVMVPIVFVGALCGIWITSRALHPLRSFIETVRKIEVGTMEGRVPLPDTVDEMQELALLVNRLLDQIATLIHGMRNALDNVAHDLRTPLTRIRGVAESALRSDLRSDGMREALADCVEESDRLLTMLNTLMDISEAETGALKLILEDVNLSQVVNDAFELYRHVADDKGLLVSLNVPPDVWVRVDRTRIRQVFANLCDNAVKYTPRQGRIEVSVSRLANSVMVAVKDTGAGIAPEELPRIWDRLYRGDQSRSERGLGLGLSLVKAVVEAHGGAIGVRSIPSQGSVFTVTLPDELAGPVSGTAQRLLDPEVVMGS